MTKKKQNNKQMDKKIYKLSIKTVYDALNFIDDINDLLNKLHTIKSVINTTKAATIKNEDILDYRLCDLFIPILDKYKLQFEGITNDKDFEDVRTWFLEKHFTYQTIKMFITELEKKLNIN